MENEKKVLLRELVNRISNLSDEEASVVATCLPTSLLLNELHGRLNTMEDLLVNISSLGGCVKIKKNNINWEAKI